MASLCRPHLDTIPPYSPGLSAEDVARSHGIVGALKLASNESARGPSPAIQDALAHALSDLNRYPDPTCRALRAALARHWAIAENELAFGHGSNELIDRLCRTFADPGDQAVAGTPSFPCYRLCCTAAEVSFVALPLRDGLYHDVDALLAACTARTKLLFLANPNNPTGTYLAVGELERLCQQLPAHVLLIVDEAYGEFATAPDYRSAIGLLPLRERLLVLRTFSKAYGLAGLRVGYAVAPAQIAEPLDRLQNPFCVNTLAQVAAVAALSDPAFLTARVEENERERTRVSEALSALGLTPVESQANFLLLRVAGAAADLFDQLVRRGVIVRPLGEAAPDLLRITVGTPLDNDRLLVALTALTRTP